MSVTGLGGDEPSPYSVTGFDERAGVIRTRDFTTGIIDGDGQVPELFERRVETGRYEDADVTDAAAAWAAWDTAEQVHTDRRPRLRYHARIDNCKSLLSDYHGGATMSTNVVDSQICNECDERSLFVRYDSNENPVCFFCSAGVLR